MYRVELKEGLGGLMLKLLYKFLMYRVELKEVPSKPLCKGIVWFLMYRVELKAGTSLSPPLYLSGNS